MCECDLRKTMSGMRTRWICTQRACGRSCGTSKTQKRMTHLHQYRWFSPQRCGVRQNRLIEHAARTAEYSASCSTCMTDWDRRLHCRADAQNCYRTRCANRKGYVETGVVHSPPVAGAPPPLASVDQLGLVATVLNPRWALCRKSQSMCIGGGRVCERSSHR